jgi:ABC-type transport system involved in cytochrome c biogenesis permease subunit
MKNLIHNIVLVLSLAFVAPFAKAGAAAQQDAGHDHAAHQQATPRRNAPYSARALELAASLPIQDGGRIKPLSTYASFLLLRMNGMRTVKLSEEKKLAPTEWLLDVLFYPDQAAEYPVFVLADVQTAEAIGVPVFEKKKRDRYSMAELRPCVDKLFELARQYGRIEEKDRKPVEQQVFALAINVNDYLQLENHFAHARFDFDTSGTPDLRRIFGADSATASQVIAKVPEVMGLRELLARNPERAEELKTATMLLQEVSELVGGTEDLALIPALGSVEQEAAWHAPVDLLQRSFEQEKLEAPYVEMLKGFENVARATGDPAAFEASLASLHERVIAQANQRGEYEKIPLEISYYKANLIQNSLVVFILGFLLVAGLWLFPRVKALYWGANVAVFTAMALLTGAIVMRCLIRERPPVSTLYETILFVTATGTLFALVTEWIGRHRLALSAAAILGVIGLFIANGYETLDKKDTMPQLVAVLDTNFWLATHVTAITIGYSAGMLAALVSTVYLIARVLGIKRQDKEFSKNLTRMTYGTLAFGLIFSVVGTILGGIWANESWGRFWGWDPKENGALLICLAQILMLHLRMGGYVREFGLHMLAAFGGTVVAFSWFGVNLLGVGLHSYGFTSGIHTALWTYYGIEWGLMGVALVHYAIVRSREAAVREALAAANKSRGAPQQGT